MAYDAGLAEILRGDLSEVPGVTEKRMFGGLAFMLDGNMLCGVHSGGGMFRVGKENEAAALALDGVAPMGFTGRRMGGFVETTDAALVDDTTRGAVMTLALGFVRGLPAK